MSEPEPIWVDGDPICCVTTCPRSKDRSCFKEYGYPDSGIPIQFLDQAPCMPMYRKLYHDEVESGHEAHGILADVCDALWGDEHRAEEHGYEGVVEKAAEIRAEKEDIHQTLGVVVEEREDLRVLTESQAGAIRRLRSELVDRDTRAETAEARIAAALAVVDGDDADCDCGERWTCPICHIRNALTGEGG